MSFKPSCLEWNTRCRVLLDLCLFMDCFTCKPKHNTQFVHTTCKPWTQPWFVPIMAHTCTRNLHCSTSYYMSAERLIWYFSKCHSYPSFNNLCHLKITLLFEHFFPKLLSISMKMATFKHLLKEYWIMKHHSVCKSSNFETKGQFIYSLFNDNVSS